MSEQIRVKFPPLYSVSGNLNRNPVRQLLRPAEEREGEMVPRESSRGSGQVFRSGTIETLVLPTRSRIPEGIDEVLHWPQVQDGLPKWLKPIASAPVEVSIADAEVGCRAVIESWRDAFQFREERRETDGTTTPGLRPPQIGALHAILAHWSVSNAPATVVMPTGTGKTETMLALLVSQRLERLVVVVPSNALRKQVSEKFDTLGLLKRVGAVAEDCLYPVVGILEHRPKSVEEVEELFRRCNVIITNMNVAGGCTEPVQRRMAELCSHLFIDEAHHIPAKTWALFRQRFLAKPIVQFTATPFRSDGKAVDGKVVYNFPLSKAQEQGYFRPIRFRPVEAFGLRQSDEAIAAAAVAQLVEDLAAGWDHIVMARVSGIPRAKELLAIYERLAPEHSPTTIHSDLNEEQRAGRLAALIARSTRIVVCVDMLGEGFDLPELKIAALHDMHKSLAITLQFTGRFTRTGGDRLGDATVVANIADPDVEGALRLLYSEDSDWNAVLRVLSEDASGRQLRRSEFVEGFTEVPPGLPLQNVEPKMSAVVYRTSCTDWRPDRVMTNWDSDRIHTGPTVNHGDKALVFVTRDQEPVPWGAIKEMQNSAWHLFLVHWDTDRRLLYINSSDTGSNHEELAKAICGDDVTLIDGERVFRVLHQVTRFSIMNLGLRHVQSRNVTFSMHSGADVGTAISEASRMNKAKSNLFGVGYEAGDKVTYGCSQKGRVWSYRYARDMSEWVAWCHCVGAKLGNEALSTAEVLKNVILPESATERPPLIPLAMEWPELLSDRRADQVFVVAAGNEAPFFEVGLQVRTHTKTDPIRFQVAFPGISVEYEVRFGSDGLQFVPAAPIEAMIRIGRKTQELSAWFRKNQPVLHFEAGALLMNGNLLKPPSDGGKAFSDDRIDTLDWSGIDLKKESQGTGKDARSIQYRVLEHLLGAGAPRIYEIVLDDDDSGEAADIVAMAVDGDLLHVDLFHCKYSGEARPGGRVDDLYAVCGQAQRSVHWKGSVREPY